MSQLVWRKSSFSGGGNGNCVEVATGSDGLIRFRESDDPDVVAVTAPASLRAFLRGAKAGAFDHVTYKP
ncbi:DUF397 domain-containing protein [Streptomyces sp. P1-3]|uniref:DUF397 domain-containing protein n=1 Tax=Streptomyces sp. P1-3 TaxID=3421658 RepID=UPI003D362BF1